jgi:hypothetical protein
MTVSQLLAGLESTEKRTKLAASKALRDLSRERPAAVYPHFERFARLLDDQNNVLKWNAILTLAHLAPVDADGRLEAILDRYLAPIDGPVMITSANTIKGAAMIAAARPNLAARIAAAIMRVEKARYATPECRNVAIGHALEALRSMRGAEARELAKRHLRNPRAATAKKAAGICKSNAKTKKKQVDDKRRSSVLHR